jgi:hypothetical protein
MTESHSSDEGASGPGPKSYGSVIDAVAKMDFPAAARLELDQLLEQLIDRRILPCRRSANATTPACE